MAGIKIVLATALSYFLVLTPLKTITGNVVTVHQGDTFTIRSVPPKEKLYKVRLSDIDTPEIRQPCGLQAKEFTTNRILGKKIQG